ncbi:MAG: lysophospholipid acyltransferase family protein [Elusimicrobiota bacterium]
MKKIYKFARNLILACFVLSCFVFFALMPYKLSLRLASLMGICGCFILSRQRKIVDNNLKRAFASMPVSCRKRLRVEVFANAGMNFAELCMFAFRSRSFWMRKVEIEGRENIQKALSEGKGIILLSAHVGNWELLGSFLSMCGYKVNVAARKIRNRFFNSLVEGVRSLRGVNMIYRDGFGNIKNMASVLKRGEVLGVLIDQDTRRGGVFVDFFGESCYTPTSVSRFSDMDNTVVVPAFIFRKRNMTHRAEILEPVKKNGSVYSDTLAHSKIVESFLIKHPSQWIWFYRRWKRRPT